MSDKLLHFAAGALVGAIFRAWLGPMAGACAGIVAGALKEVYDWRRGGTVDPADFVVTVFGAVAAELTLELAGG